MTVQRRAAARFSLIAMTALVSAAATAAEAGSAPSHARPAPVVHPALWPGAKSPAAITDPATEAFITGLMARMSLEEKVGQTVQADISTIAPEDLRKYPLGALLAGGNSGPYGDDRAPAARWVQLIEAFRTVAAEARPGHTPVPLIFGIDAVHGHNNIIGATLFPHNIGLGAARDPELIGRIGQATAEEVAVTGADWTFGPTLAVPRDPRWGRSYEGYGQEPEIGRAYAAPMTLGLQGPLEPGKPLAAGHIAGSAKHFLADGGTTGGKDQGDAALAETDLIRLHAQGYPPAIDAGILTVMTSFSSWNGVKHTGDRALISEVLKGRMGFQGFVVDDWNAHGQIPGCLTTDCPQAMNAGLDMYMAPDSWKGLFESLVAEVKSGVIPAARLDDAVRRILRVKVKAGLFNGARPLEGRFDRLGAPDHRALALEAVRESLVLLKNNGAVLPIRASARVLVAGDGADDIGRQSGGWTISWQGTGNVNADFPHGQSIYAGVAEALKAGGGEAELKPAGDFTRKPDVAIVVFGETPYAEFQGDIPTLEYQPGEKHDLALIRRLRRAGIPVVSVFLSGRPLWTNPEINASNAFVAAWLPGTEGGGVADVLIRRPDGAVNRDFRGRLSFAWPARAGPVRSVRGDARYAVQFAYGYGLSYRRGAAVRRLSEDPGERTAQANLDRYFAAGRVPAPWALSVEGAVSVQPADASAQEDSRRASWTGQGPGAIAITGAPVDLSRQTTGDMALVLRYRVDQPAAGPVTLSVACGTACGAKLDATSLFAAGPPGQWRTTKIKLSCFRAQGARMDRITSPFGLATDGRFALTLSELRLATNNGDAGCPAAR